MIWNTRRTPLDLARKACVMGILNVTPDSFSDGGRHPDPESAMEHARKMISEGALLIDIGGESTRPGALPVSAREELARTIPIVTALRAEWEGWISIDTMKAAVARAAIAAGADIVNDVSGLTADAQMTGICAESGCGVVVMHMRGTPRTMQAAPAYGNVVAEVRSFFEERHSTLIEAGIRAESICFDPGIGFGKTLEHNLSLLRGLDELAVGNRPVLLGVSRKSFISRLLDSNPKANRDWPTVALTAFSRQKGVMLHRVHSVRPNVEALKMTEAILHGGSGKP